MRGNECELCPLCRGNLRRNRCQNCGWRRTDRERTAEREPDDYDGRVEDGFAMMAAGDE